MISQFQENIVGGDLSAHNLLAVSVASIRHDVRFHGDNFVERLYGFCEAGLQCSESEMKRSSRRVVIKYDSEKDYDIPSNIRLIEFGVGKEYLTFPVDWNYHRLPTKVDQTVSYGKIRSIEHAERYMEALRGIGGRVVLANVGKKEYISLVKDMLEAVGMAVSVPITRTFALLDVYLRTSARLVHFGDDNNGAMYAKGCLYALGGAEFITDRDKVVPTDLTHFIREEKI